MAELGDSRWRELVTAVARADTKGATLVPGYMSLGERNMVERVRRGYPNPSDVFAWVVAGSTSADGPIHAMVPLASILSEASTVQQEFLRWAGGLKPVQLPNLTPDDFDAAILGSPTEPGFLAAHHVMLHGSMLFTDLVGQLPGSSDPAQTWDLLRDLAGVGLSIGILNGATERAVRRAVVSLEADGLPGAVRSVNMSIRSGVLSFGEQRDQELSDLEAQLPEMPTPAQTPTHLEGRWIVAIRKQGSRHYAVDSFFRVEAVDGPILEVSLFGRSGNNLANPKEHVLMRKDVVADPADAVDKGAQVVYLDIGFPYAREHHTSFRIDPLIKVTKRAAAQINIQLSGGSTGKSFLDTSRG